MYENGRGQLPSYSMCWGKYFVLMKHNTLQVCRRYKPTSVSIHCTRNAHIAIECSVSVSAKIYHKRREQKMKFVCFAVSSVRHWFDPIELHALGCVLWIQQIKYDCSLHARIVLQINVCGHLNPLSWNLSPNLISSYCVNTMKLQEDMCFLTNKFMKNILQTGQNYTNIAFELQMRVFMFEPSIEWKLREILQYSNEGKSRIKSFCHLCSYSSYCS